MSSSTTQFITGMKLRELHRQRDRLRETYQRLGAEVAQARDTGLRLRALSEGLRGLKFAGQPLHPEVVNLETLLFEAEAGTLSPDVAALWLRRLEDELSAGRLRSEFVYLFGALLEEWGREPSAAPQLLEEGRQAHNRLLAAALTPPESTHHADLLGTLFDAIGPPLADLGERLRKTARDTLRTPVHESALSDVLPQIADNIYQPPRLRREARRFAANELLRKELADALTIVVAELDAWDWPADGFAARALWTRNKWRLYLDEDLPTACLLEVLGRRWLDVLSIVLFPHNVTERRARLQKLLQLDAPQVIIENERRMLRQAMEIANLGSEDEDKTWEDTGPAAAAEPESDSVVVQRAAYRRSLREVHAGGDYGDGYGGDVNRAVVLVNAEVQLARAAYPDRPLYVVKLDLQDYYPSIPHAVLLSVLERLGVEEADRVFVARFLAPPVRQGEGPSSPLRRGVPMNHALSGLLAELLLRLLEGHVTRHARVRVVRLVDDICLLTPEPAAAVEGWRRVEELCTACGLAVNRPKSGAVCLGGELPAGLPTERPRWGMLELDDRGRWQVNRETFEAHREQAQQRVAGAAAVLSRVQLYNANLKYLLSALTLGAALGEDHRASADRAVRRFHQEFFGPGQGIVAGLCATIRERFRLDAADIPEGWVYWPITAGGLGLRNPLVTAGQYAEGDHRRTKVPAPKERAAGWDTQSNAWAAFYRTFLEPVRPVEPQDTPVMKTLVDDFIARGSSISAGQQQGLSPYWRWVLYAYGPQILQRFGTFRFLITELIPLQLISQQRLEDTSLDEANRPAAEQSRSGEDIPF
jgi:hypothetical protein